MQAQLIVLQAAHKLKTTEAEHHENESELDDQAGLRTKGPAIGRQGQA